MAANEIITQLRIYDTNPRHFERKELVGKACVKTSRDAPFAVSLVTVTDCVYCGIRTDSIILNYFCL